VNTQSLVTGLVTAMLIASPGGARWATVAPPRGPFRMLLFNTSAAPRASATAQLIYAHSPFGVAVTGDGRAVYDIVVTATGLPAPRTLGRYTTYVAWAATPDLAHWTRLGTVGNGAHTVGPVDFNKFLFVISAEASAAGKAADGPTVLHGTSPSGYLQTFLGHGLFKLPQG
jgi:hypothetical protein